MNDCQKCKWDENKDNDLICEQCNDDYFFNEYGECIKCSNDRVRVKDNKCVSFDNIDYGGIEGCSLCKSDNNIIECEKCHKGFIFYENNKTCLKIVNNTELEQYPNCIRLKNENNNLQCTLCEIFSYNLITEYDCNKYISSDFFPTHNMNYNKYCEKFINLGTEDKPKYSCHKCIDNIYLENENDKLTLFTFDSNRTSFCDLITNYNLGNCSKAYIFERSEGENDFEYSCNTCYEGYIYCLNQIPSFFYCDYNKKCQVNNCKKCIKDNINFCETCLIPDYEPDSTTGSCMKKEEEIPSINWQDIFGLKMGQVKEINGKNFYGPSLNLRGITYSQINDGHAFSFNLTIKKEDQEEKIIPMICQVNEGVDESNEPNMIEYNCIGNLSYSESSQLNNDNVNIINLAEDNIKNIGKLNPSNLNDMSFSNIKKEESDYSLQKFLTTVVFTLDEIKNQTSNNYKFDFILKGNIQGNINKEKINIEIPFAEIDKNAKCILNIKETKNADLNCNISLEEYTDYNIFSFKSVSFEDEEGTIILYKINEIYLINEKEEENKSKNKNEKML